jgi:PIN domain nuclease of toxin-antitoxin system
MNLLLDTHAFLWFVSGDARLSAVARTLIEDGGNLKLVSIASLWEMAIKLSMGRLTFNSSFEDFVPRQMEINGFDLFHVQVQHLAKIVSLPFHHRDPFDRLLAGQCLSDGLDLISCDPVFDLYGVRRVW